MKRKGLFITGTDTDVGKTYITMQIIRQLHAITAPIKVRKPIESGCSIQNNGELHPADGFSLWQANQMVDTLNTVTPYRFEPAIAPNRAAALSKKTINTDDLKAACLNQVNTNDFLIVEGAGGFYSPLSSDGLNVDLAKALNLNIVLVVKDQLGCINHTLLTLSAIKKVELNCVAIVLNLSSYETEKTYDHLSEIKIRSQLPVFSCHVNAQLEPITNTLLIS